MSSAMSLLQSHVHKRTCEIGHLQRVHEFDSDRERTIPLLLATCRLLIQTFCDWWLSARSVR